MSDEGTAINPLCACGCGKETTGPTKTFVRGHHTRLTAELVKLVRADRTENLEPALRRAANVSVEFLASFVSRIENVLGYSTPTEQEQTAEIVAAIAKTLPPQGTVKKASTKVDAGADLTDPIIVDDPDPVDEQTAARDREAAALASMEDAVIEVFPSGRTVVEVDPNRVERQQGRPMEPWSLNDVYAGRVPTNATPPAPASEFQAIEVWGIEYQGRVSAWSEDGNPSIWEYVTKEGSFRYAEDRDIRTASRPVRVVAP